MILTERDLADRVSVLFNEPKLLKFVYCTQLSRTVWVSVLFNEPKLLKLSSSSVTDIVELRFSALQRAEIAEMLLLAANIWASGGFQCSSTSRNC